MSILQNILPQLTRINFIISYLIVIFYVEVHIKQTNFLKMGSIMSMCGGDNKNLQQQNPIQNKTSVSPHPKKRQGPLAETEKSTPNQPKSVKKQSNGTIKPQQSDKKQQKQDLFDMIQKNFPAPPNNKIQWESFDVTHRIGGGGFGEVFLAQLKENRDKGIVEKYAIKRVIKNQIFQSKLTENLKLQKRILQQSNSHFITALHYAFQDQTFLYFVMQWASGGDVYSLISDPLKKRVEQFKIIGEVGVRFILGCLILGMEYLHNHNIMYRDLKPQNILIFENGYVKLTDFGLAKEIHEDQINKTEAGTSFYYSPQMVLRGGYQKYIDLWAIGIFAYQISNYHPPFEGTEIKDRQRVKRLVENAQKHRIWKNPKTSDELKDFINSLLRFDPKQRLGYKSWDQIKNHKFFTCVQFDWKALESLQMVSPLKEIIQNNKLKPKKYNPSEPTKQQKKAELNKAPGGDPQVQGWTYVNEEKDQYP